MSKRDNPPVMGALGVTPTRMLRDEHGRFAHLLTTDDCVYLDQLGRPSCDKLREGYVCCVSAVISEGTERG
jgi:hypothetical protein